MDVQEPERGRVLVLRGRLDARSAPDVRQSLHRVVDGGTGEVLVDVEHLVLVDVSSLGLLLEAHRPGRARRRHLVLVAVPAPLQRMLRVTRLDRVLHHADRVVAGPPPRRTAGRLRPTARPGSLRDWQDRDVELALVVTAVVIVVLAVSAAADRLDVPAPLLLVVVGVVVAFVPVVPDIEISDDLVLLGLLPPLLYAAAIRTSLIDFRANTRPIVLLSVVLVIVSTLVVGAVAHWLLPIGWPAALALGAVVAPPDAVAATSIARRVGMPRRVVTILEGESLVERRHGAGEPAHRDGGDRRALGDGHVGRGRPRRRR